VLVFGVFTVDVSELELTGNAVLINLDDLRMVLVEAVASLFSIRFIALSLGHLADSEQDTNCTLNSGLDLWRKELLVILRQFRLDGFLFLQGSLWLLGIGVLMAQEVAR